MRRREITLPTILGLVLTIGGLISGIWLMRGQLQESVKAVAGEEPKEVKIVNVEDNTFTVAWMTDKSVTGFVQYGQNGELNQVVADERDQQMGEIGSYFTHFVTIKGLKISTAYSFKIGSGKKIYEVSTGPSLTNPPAADVAYGTVMTANREPANGAIVFLDIPGVTTQAALVKETGSWVIPLATARSVNLDSYAQYDKQTAMIQLTISDGPMGRSTTTVAAKDDAPVEEIVLGENIGGSKLGNELRPTEAVAGGEVQILTPNNGESVNTSKPEIVGKAPAGAEVTIEIHSNVAIMDKVMAGSDGTFSFSVSEDLPPGQHTVTISALVNGIVQTVTRSFTVYAVGENSIPFYSASPSATLAPSPSPTSKPGPTAKPTPTVKPSPTLRPSPTLKPTVAPIIAPLITEAPTPTPATNLVRSGNESPTILLLIAGMVMMVGGGWFYRKAR